MEPGTKRETPEAFAEPPKLGRRKLPEPGAPWSEVESVILTRRSVRLYLDKQVPEHLVRRVLEAGRYAPSTGNTQPWRFVVVRDPQILADMTGTIRKQLKVIAPLLDYTRPGSKASRFLTARLMRLRPNEIHPTPIMAFSLLADGKLEVWHGAPTVIFLLADTRGVGTPLLDLGIAGQNMVLAAHSLGLGTCWVSFAKLLELSRKHRKTLQVQHPYRLITSIALGIPRGQPDGFVPREKHDTLWIEPGGETRSVK